MTTENQQELSIAILDLNRSELIERRKALVDKWKKETNETYKKLLYSATLDTLSASMTKVDASTKDEKLWKDSKALKRLYRL